MTGSTTLLVNIRALNIRTSKYYEGNSNRIDGRNSHVIADFSAQIPIMGRTTRQEINEETGFE